jgi:hypothetical protein
MCCKCSLCSFAQTSADQDHQPGASLLALYNACLQQERRLCTWAFSGAPCTAAGASAACVASGASWGATLCAMEVTCTDVRPTLWQRCVCASLRCAHKHQVCHLCLHGCGIWSRTSFTQLNCMQMGWWRRHIVEGRTTALIDHLVTEGLQCDATDGLPPLVRRQLRRCRLVIRQLQEVPARVTYRVLSLASIKRQRRTSSS